MYLNNHTSVHVGIKIVRVLGIDKVCSPYCQFLLVKKGSVVFRIDDGPEFTLDKGSVVVIKANHTYYCRPLSPNTLIGFRIDAQFIAGLIPPGHELICNSAADPETDYTWLGQLLTEICSAYYSSNNENRMMSLLYKMADCLTEYHIHKISADHSAGDFIIQERIGDIRHYVETNYHQAISLSALAEKMFLTPQYLSRFIKKHMDISFGRYLTQVRLERAYSELIHTDHSVTNIAMNNGFPNISAFHKIFRETYGDAPGTYRSNYKLPETSSGNVIAYDADEVLTPHRNISIHPDTEPKHVSGSAYRDMINIGPLEHAMNPEFRATFDSWFAVTPFSYIRCYNMFSDKVICFDQKNQEYNLNNFFEIIDYFRSLNASPCFEISYKPPKDPNILPISWENDDSYSGELDHSYYLQTLSELLLRSIRRYGTAYVESWRFDIWCKTGEKLTLSESPEAYIEKYRDYYETIKQLLPACAVGGPGFNMCGDLETFTSYMKSFYKQHVRFDFISLYGFIYKTAGKREETSMISGAILSPNPEHIPDTFRKYKKAIRTCGYEKVPVFLCEFGSVLNVNGYITESMYQAEFLIHNILALQTEADSIASMGWIDYEPWPIPYSRLYYPSTGLFTSHGIPKPSFYAYDILFRLGNDVLSSGDHHIMTRTTPDRYQLLLWHYVHFDESYCFHPMEPVPLADTYNILKEPDPIQIGLSCEAFPEGRYKCRKHTLNASHGSVLDTLIETLKKYPQDANEYLAAFNQTHPEELQYYRRVSVPKQEIYYEQVHTELHMSTELQPNEILFFEFQREL